VRRNLAIVGLAAWVTACGSDEAAVEVYQPRLCGQEGPVMVLALDEPFRSFFSIDEVGDRLLVRRFGVRVNSGVRQASFATDLVGACGQDPVALAETLWPIRVGDALFGCDIIDGAVYPVDPMTAALGGRIEGTYECEPLARDDEHVLLIDRSDEATESLAVLRSTGDVEPLAIPYTIPEDDLDRLAEYLDNPLYPSRRTRAYEGTLWMQGDDDNLWRWDAADGVRLAASSVHDFALDWDSGLVVVASTNEAEPGLYATLVLDPQTEEVRAAPPIEELIVLYGYMFVPGALYDIVDGTTHPYPPGVPEGEFAWLDADGIANVVTPQRVLAWEVESGEVLLDVPAMGFPCGAGSTVDGELPVRWSDDDECLEVEVWRYPLDGSEPYLLTQEDAPDFTGWPDEDGWFLRRPLVLGRWSADLTYENARTGEVIVIDRGVSDLPSIQGEALGFPQTPMLLYRIADGPRTGIWRSELPEP
jgi:hypothetical protein